MENKKTTKTRTKTKPSTKVTTKATKVNPIVDEVSVVQKSTLNNRKSKKVVVNIPIIEKEQIESQKVVMVESLEDTPTITSTILEVSESTNILSPKKSLSSKFFDFCKNLFNRK